MFFVENRTLEDYLGFFFQNMDYFTKLFQWVLPLLHV